MIIFQHLDWSKTFKLIRNVNSKKKLKTLWTNYPETQEKILKTKEEHAYLYSPGGKGAAPLESGHRFAKKQRVKPPYYLTSYGTKQKQLIKESKGR